MTIRSRCLSQLMSGNFDELPKVDPNSELYKKLKQLELPQRLSRVRDHYKFTLKEMASVIGKQPIQVRRYELGEANVGYLVRCKLAKLTGLAEGFFRPVPVTYTKKPDMKMINDLMRYTKDYLRLLKWRSFYYKGSTNQLAEELGMSSYYIRQLEAGRMSISILMADKLAGFSQLPISVFYNGPL